MLQEFQERTEVDKEEMQQEEEEEEEEATRQTVISQQSPLTSQKQDTKVSITCLTCATIFFCLTRPISLLRHLSLSVSQLLSDGPFIIIIIIVFVDRAD